MSFANTFENDLLKLIFQNIDASLIGDATGLRGSTTPGSIYVSLHSADPGEAGDQTTNELSFGAYVRKPLARSVAGFTVATNNVQNAAAVTFDAASSGSGTARFFGFGTAVSGAGKLLARGPLGTGSQGLFTATVADTLTIPGHTLIVNDLVVFFATPGSALPTGITEGTFYFVKTVSGNDITISTTAGGATLDITVAGDGIAFKAQELAISVGVSANFAIGALSLTID
jgi:hypothetical protein